jgi:hypothetical protein
VAAAPLEDAVDADLEADQDYLQQADRYEAQYNFRFQVCLLYALCDVFVHVQPGTRCKSNCSDTAHAADAHRGGVLLQEPGAAHTITHPRGVEGSVRRTDERRKQARATPLRDLATLLILLQAMRLGNTVPRMSCGTMDAGTGAEGKKEGGGGAEAAGGGQKVHLLGCVT